MDGWLYEELNKVSPQRCIRVAMRRLILKRAMLLERGDIKEFHYRLSESLRKYNGISSILRPSTND